MNCAYETGVEVVSLYVTNDVMKRSVQKVKVFQGKAKVDNVIDADGFSCVWKLLRVTAWVKRFRRELEKEGEGGGTHAQIPLHPGT